VRCEISEHVPLKKEGGMFSECSTSPSGKTVHVGSTPVNPPRIYIYEYYSTFSKKGYFGDSGASRMVGVDENIYINFPGWCSKHPDRI
jgi:hypothetical protein